MLRLRIVNDLSASDQGLKKLIDSVLMGIDARVCLHGQNWNPQMDIYETAEAYIIIADLAGLNPDEIELVVDQNGLKISGCRNQPSSSVQMLVHQMEIDYGVFDRTFRLPSPIIPEKASATSDQGLLKIVLKKETKRQTKIGVVRK